MSADSRGSKGRKAQDPKRRGVATVRRRLEQLGPSVSLLSVDPNTLRRWRTGELTPSALACAFLAMLVLLQKGGVDLGALVAGRVQADPYGPLAPRWENDESDDNEGDLGNCDGPEADANLAAASVSLSSRAEHTAGEEQASVAIDAGKIPTSIPRAPKRGIVGRAVAALASAVARERESPPASQDDSPGRRLVRLGVVAGLSE